VWAEIKIPFGGFGLAVGGACRYNAPDGDAHSAHCLLLKSVVGASFSDAEPPPSARKTLHKKLHEH